MTITDIQMKSLYFFSLGSFQTPYQIAMIRRILQSSVSSASGASDEKPGS